jgi:hypothetical protein
MQKATIVSKNNTRHNEKYEGIIHMHTNIHTCVNKVLYICMNINSYICVSILW